MRLFLLPISSKHTLIYAQRLNRQLIAKQGYPERITAWASTKWTQWEASDKPLWQKITTWGNNAFARIPYQEWGLKSIPPLSARRKKEELRGKEEVDAIYPSSIIKPANAPGLLRRIATERQALHKKWMWWSIIGLPFTAPVALIPIIPNLPFFYLAFRAWSHWKALSGSRHIESLLDKQLIRLVESPSLAKIYSARNFSPKELDDLQKSAQQVETPKEREQQVTERLKSEQPNAIDLKSDSSPDLLIVKKDTGRLVSICFGLPQISMEIERASTQVSKEIDKVNEDRTQKASVEKQ
ncbi:hypothetical protein MMC10_005646 [Thelotrema lepadinum]|nr:hypothetical protein [Thelotrema lepadinum]